MLFISNLWSLIRVKTTLTIPHEYNTVLLCVCVIAMHTIVVSIIANIS